MATGKSKGVHEEYKIALQDLTFNSKPMINVLTMLAEENSDYGPVIVQTISERIKQVNIEQKMPALYLLDSILKNIGGDYVNIISKDIVDIFSHVFENTIDERQRMQLFKLRNTWTQYILTKTLFELDVKISKIDPNWPVVAANSGNTQHTNAKIHVNPKFLQKSEPILNKETSAKLSTTEQNITGPIKLQTKINKQRLLDEEKRVQEQLKLLQVEKLKRDREEHEMELKQQQLHRERLLAEQNRQLQVLRKQQQDIANLGQKNLNSQRPELNHFSDGVVSDPRRKIISPNNNRNKDIKVNTKLAARVPPSKKTSPKALTVLNKIMTGLSANKAKPISRHSSKNQPDRQSKSSLENSTTKHASSPQTTTKKIIKETEKKVADTKMSGVPSGETESVAKLAAVTTPSTTISTVSQETNATPVSAFIPLSSRDMQIAAQAAAIATALHQMQTGMSAVGPEQSALIAAQLIKVMQGNTEGLPGVLPVTTAVPSVVTSTVPAYSTAADESDNGNNNNKTNEIENKNSNLDKLNKNKKELTSEKNIKKSPGSSNRNDHDKVETVSSKEQSKSTLLEEKTRKNTRGRSRTNSDSSEAKKQKENSEHSERSRKTRARSPSRYYCRVEKKIEVDKRVEKKEKELVLERIRKNSDGPIEQNQMESGDHCEIEIDEDLDDIELPEAEDKYREASSEAARKDENTDVSNVAEISVGIKPEKMTEEQWEELQKIRKKEFVILRTRLLGFMRQRDERKAPVDPALISDFKNECQSKFEEGKLSTEQIDNLLSQVSRFDRAGSEHLHWRSRPDLQHGLTPHRPLGRGRNNDGQHPRDGRMRDRPPHHTRDAPWFPRSGRDGPRPQSHRDGSPHGHTRERLPPHHMRDGPGKRIRDGPPPPHMRDGGPPPHMRDARPRNMRDGPPPHMRDGPPPHMRDGPPPHMRDGPPPHMRDGPPPHMRDGPPPHMRDGPPPHMRDGPPPHMRDGPPPHMRDGPPPHMRDGPPPHMRDGPPPHMRDGPPPHMIDGPPPHLRDGPPPHMRDGPPPHMREGPPPHMRDGAPPPHDGYYNPHIIGNAGVQEPYYRHSPPPGETFINTKNTEGPAMPNVGSSLDVNNLLGQLLAAGMLNKENAKEKLDLDAPKLKFRIEDLRKRYQAVINHLFQGLQCSSCGQRFPDNARKQYGDHLDWHFRQNRKEKDGIRKVSSRKWYYDVHDWVDHTEETVVDDEGKSQSAFFESERADPDNSATGTTDNSTKKPGKKLNERTVAVTAADGDGVCSVCMESLEQYWDEDQEEWRYKDAVREGNQVYHHYCFNDFVPFEFEEITTPTTSHPVTPNQTEQPSLMNKNRIESKKDEIETVQSNDQVETSPSLEKAEDQVKTTDSVNEKPSEEILPITSSKDDVEDVTLPTISSDNEQKTKIEQEECSISNHTNVLVKKESTSDEDTNAELLELEEAPDSPEYPLIASTSSQTLSDAALTGTFDDITSSNQYVTTIGQKRSIGVTDSEVPAKGLKLEDEENIQCDKSLSSVVNENISDSVMIEPNINQVQTVSNKIVSEAT